jgi:hypothetical protein
MAYATILGRETPDGIRIIVVYEESHWLLWSW